MKKYLSVKYLLTAGFLLMIGVYFLLSIKTVSAKTWEVLGSAIKGEKVSFSDVEYAYNQQFPLKSAWITLNGGWQRAMGARVVNERYKLDNGQLTYIIPELDMEGIAANTVAFRDALEAEGFPLVYVNSPFKVDPADEQLPAGVEDFSNDNADRFLAILEENDFKILDLRKTIKEEGLDHYSLFYPTDHHWTAEAGFWATEKIVDFLVEQDPSFAVDERITDLNSYDQKVHEKILIGSAGTRVGPLYSGMDDFTEITPKFETDLHFAAPDYDVDRKGSYRETVFFPEKLEGANVNTNCYGAYGGTNYSLLDVHNNSIEKNLQVQSTGKRLLILRESYSCVLVPFLSLGYEDCSYVDLRYFTGDLMEHIRQYQPDMVLIIYNPGAYEDNNLIMFDFLK